MASFLFILKFLGSTIFIFAFGSLVGHFLKLDKYYEDMQKQKNEDIQKFNKEDNLNDDNLNLESLKNK